jgi:hypothetical protein
VLNFSQTVAGLGCPAESTATTLTDLVTNYCNGGTFDGAEVTCVNPDNPGEPLAKTEGVATVANTFDVNFLLPIHVKTDKLHCKSPLSIVPFTIFGNQNLDVKQIDLSSLRFAGVETPPVGLKCLHPFDVNRDKFKDLSCVVNSCPDIGPALKALRGSNNKKVVVPVAVPVTGSLIAIPPSSEGTAIFGEDLNVKTLP